MKTRKLHNCIFVWMVGMLMLTFSPLLLAQGSGSTAVTMPHLIQFNGVLKDDAGHPKSGMAGVTFALYREQEGGAPLWLETQTVQADGKGNYTVLLGSTKSAGLPTDIFASGEARWLGVQVQGQPEQPRVLFTAAPYALKAGDAETLGGKPASAFMTATSGSHSNSTPSLGPALGGTGTPNHITKWITSTKLGNSGVFENSGGEVGIGTTSPAAKLDLNGKGDIRDTLTLFPSGSDPALSVSGTAFQITNNGTVSFVSGQTFPGTGTITGVTAGTDLTGGGNSGNVTLNLDTSKVPQLGAANTFTANQTINGNLSLKNLTASSEVQGQFGFFQGANGDILVAENESTGSSGIGVVGSSLATSGIGVEGNGATGVLGQASTSNGIGVEGTGAVAVEANVTTSNGIGVWAIAPSTAVGVLASGYAGVIGSGAAANGAQGVAGFAGNSGKNYGVEGESGSVNGTGVYGFAVSASKSNIVGCCPAGVWGDTGSNAGGATGLAGTADDARAIYLANNSPSGVPTAYMYQGFNGSNALQAGGNGGFCTIDWNGHLFCPHAMSIVAGVQGGERQVALYSMQSPQNWSEDFGSGRLTGGTARVALDATFAETINTDVDYHVFLTPRDECEGLYVSSTSANGFEVRELHRGRSNVAFDYRIVALRRGLESVRLEDMTERWKKLSERPPEMAPGQRNNRPVLPQLPTAPLKPAVVTPAKLSAER